jgi:hypothetical protein
MLAMQGAIASKRALAPDERPKRLREGWASRKRCANGAGRMNAPERPIRYPLSASYLATLLPNSYHVTDESSS